MVECMNGRPCRERRRSSWSGPGRPAIGLSREGMVAPAAAAGKNAIQLICAQDGRPFISNQP
jgi:hypothetical protein